MSAPDPRDADLGWLGALLCLASTALVVTAVVIAVRWWR